MGNRPILISVTYGTPSASHFRSAWYSPMRLHAEGAAYAAHRFDRGIDQESLSSTGLTGFRASSPSSRATRPRCSRPSAHRPWPTLTCRRFWNNTDTQKSRPGKNGEPRRNPSACHAAQFAPQIDPFAAPVRQCRATSHPASRSRRATGPRSARPSGRPSSGLTCVKDALARRHRDVRYRTAALIAQQLVEVSTCPGPPPPAPAGGNRSERTECRSMSRAKYLGLDVAVGDQELDLPCFSISLKMSVDIGSCAACPWHRVEVREVRLRRARMDRNECRPPCDLALRDRTAAGCSPN